MLRKQSSFFFFSLFCLLLPPSFPSLESCDVRGTQAQPSQAFVRRGIWRAFVVTVQPYLKEEVAGGRTISAFQFRCRQEESFQFTSSGGEWPEREVERIDGDIAFF